MKTIAIFCGSSVGSQPEYARAAEALVHAMAKRECRVVYGAGSTGLMGVLGNAAIEAKLFVTGVVPSFFMNENVVHKGLSELIVTSSMAERKEVIMANSDAFIALPGGFGTFDELFEVLTAVQLGLQVKPVGILNTLGYFDSLLAMLDCSVNERFVRADHLKALSVDHDPELLLAKMESNNYKAPEHWIEKLIERNHF